MASLVAEPGQSLADDRARVNAVRALVPTVRVDANGGWSVDEAVDAAAALTADGPLEYLEQPCSTVAELAELRRRVDVPIAADESIRKAADPLLIQADRARRAAGVGSTFPISGYDDLTAAQIQSRLDALSPAELRKVRDYERRRGNRKSVLDAIEAKLA